VNIQVLEPGESMMVNAECVLAVPKVVTWGLELTGSPLNALLGREGMYLARLENTGSIPGTVYLSPLQAARQVRLELY
jgi:uncharacterized protein (AIM24 family)